ncbi:MAG: hypothetical protein WBY01_21110, partial [Pseudolabrys sp.]
GRSWRLLRHARHPRLVALQKIKTWMAGSSPAMTGPRVRQIPTCIVVSASCPRFFPAMTD